MHSPQNVKFVNPSNPRKYAILNGDFVFDLHDVFQECNPDVKQDLSLL